MAESPNSSMLSAVTEEHSNKGDSIIQKYNNDNVRTKPIRKTRGNIILKPKILKNNSKEEKNTVQSKKFTKTKHLLEAPSTSASSRSNNKPNTGLAKLSKNQVKVPQSPRKRTIETDTEDTEEEISTRDRKRRNLNSSDIFEQTSSIANRTRSQTHSPQTKFNQIKTLIRSSKNRIKERVNEHTEPTKRHRHTTGEILHSTRPTKFQKLPSELNTSRFLRSNKQRFEIIRDKDRISSTSSSNFESQLVARNSNILTATVASVHKKRQKLNDLSKNSSNKKSDHSSTNLGARVSRGSSSDLQEQPQNLLRRSSRAKSSTQTANTGSCVSSTAPANNNSSPSNTTDSSLSRVAHRYSNSKSATSEGAASTSKNNQQTFGVGFDLSAGAGPSTSKQPSVGITSSNSNIFQEQIPSINPFSKLQKTSLSSGGIQGNSQQSTTFGYLSTSNMETSGGQLHDSESDDSEVNRLQALLEARGLPPHLFGALGPRMHHLLHRSMGASSTSKAQILLQGLQSNDESQQLQAAIEMCQMLVMGNEDTLAGFPIKQVVPSLIILLRMEHNFDIMINACRALAYMLEALPRSSATVVDAIPAFLEKLQVIQWVDVAEQSLTALEILSRRHNKAILQANGISACLVYLDFFSINAQRCALSITANCCQNLNKEEFEFVRESLPLLARLLSQQDKKSVESICTAFHRLVDSFQHDSSILQLIVSKELLKNCQQLLVVVPPVLNSATFTNVVRMLSLICTNCPDLALTLLKSDIASTLLYLLTGTSEIDINKEVELISRNPSEIYEITCLIGELMPRLPNDGIFNVDILLERPNSSPQYTVQWQWKDDRNIWRSYNAIDSRMIEAAHLNSDEEITLTSLGRTYTIDYGTMTQINEDTGTTRMIQRKLSPSNQMFHKAISMPSSMHQNTSTDVYLDAGSFSNDARISCLKEERGLASNFIKTLFSVLYEVYSSSAGPAVRYKCLRALLRMVYFANTDLLKEVLKIQLVSSHIAGMLASNDLRIVVGALQMAEILMQKLPDVFAINFRREGVMHQINLLAESTMPICIVQSPKLETLSAPPCTSSANTSFNFDHHAVASTSKGPIDKTDMFSQTNMCLSVPSTSSTLIPSLPTTKNNSSSAAYQGHLSFEMNIASSDSSRKKSEAMPGLQNVNKPTEADDSLSKNRSNSTNSESTSNLHLRMSDILKRKVPLKRGKSATTPNARPKAGPEDHQRSTNNDVSSSLDLQQYQSSSIMNELVNKTNHFGGYGRTNTTNSSINGKAKQSNTSSSKTTSFLASLNPARWGRSGSHNSLSKDQGTKDYNFMSNSNLLVAGNREKIRQWIREQCIKFVKQYPDQVLFSNEPISSAFSILNRLKNAIQRLDGTLNECLNSLQELRDILIESDISPFEVNHSGLIKAMIDFMTDENSIVNRNDRLRAFLHVFSGLPLDGNHNGTIHQINPASFSTFVAKLNSCVSQLEQFPVKVHDLPGGVGGRSNTSALKFFNTHQLKCNLQRHPDCSNLRQWKGGTVKIDPLALVQAIERYLVIRGYGGIRVDSEEDSEDEIDNIDTATMMNQQNNTTHKLQFLIGDEILPYNMTVYQAIRQYSPLAQDLSETETDTENAIGNASIWAQQHTIYYRPVQHGAKATSISVSNRRANKYCVSKTGNKKKTDNWSDGVVPPIVSPLSIFLTPKLPEVVTVQDASLHVLTLLRIVNALNRHWTSLYIYAPYINIIPQSEFVHSKIAAKATRQLQDPLVIMTGNLPQWLQQISAVCPFLFPFETRQLLFYAISFDRDRALQRLLETTPDLNSSDSSERVTPRLDRRKRAISRENILKQAEAIMQDFGHSKALLEIQYENEVGTGLGPTLEFYALVSTELQRCDLCLWNDSNSYKSSQQKSSNIVTDDILKTDTHNVSLNLSTTTQKQIKMTRNQETNQINDINLHMENNTQMFGQNDSLNMLIEQSDTIVLHSNADNSVTFLDEISEITSSNNNKYVKAPFGLFPAPLSKSAKTTHISRVKNKFKFMGKFMAKAVMDSRLLDLPFSIPFYRWLLTEEHTFGLGDLQQVAPEIQATLLRLNEIVIKRDIIQDDNTLDAIEKKEKIENLDLDGCLIADLGLDFVLPGHSNIELRRGGRDIPVTIHNLHQYISLVTYWFLNEGVSKQFEALKEGFDSVFPSHRLRMFYPEELENIFCGTGMNNYEVWDQKMLAECCRPDHGFTQDSKTIKYFYEILSTYTKEEQRLFLQFVTGTPRLPTGGFKALTPPLTIVRKTNDGKKSPDDYLPSVMTCVNYLKLPEYTTKEIMRQKLKFAANEGSMCFHLS